MQHSLGMEKEELTTDRVFLMDPLLGRTRLYRGKERDRVLRICGWPAFGDLAQLDLFIDENTTNGCNQSRAVAAALLTGNSARMKKVLASMLEKTKELNDGSYDEIEQFQDAVFHYKGVPEQWKSISESLKKCVRDPYFNMIITYLDGRCDNFADTQCILQQKDVPLEDRVAFAAIHFSDQSFVKCIRDLYNEENLERRLLGLLFTGISQREVTHDLLSGYVDRTGDLQTASILLAIGRCFIKEQFWPNFLSSEASSSEFKLMTPDSSEVACEIDDHIRRSYGIVQDYLDMLNTWGLCMQRARFDCILGRRNDIMNIYSDSAQSFSEAEVCCQFCTNTVALDKSDISAVSASSAILVPTTKSSITSVASSNTPPITAREIACQSCLKPLPKCILCHRHLGSYVQSECRELGRLSSWFTWCQKCRHGGHMAHLRHWFNQHDECPASGCVCFCQMTDSNIIVENSAPQSCVFCEDL